MTVVEVFRWTSWSEDEIPKTLPDLIVHLQAKMAEVPEEFRAQVEVEHDTDYEGGWTLKAHYRRPETDAEAAEREANDARWAAITAERERSEFERLKRKFEK